MKYIILLIVFCNYTFAEPGCEENTIALYKMLQNNELYLVSEEEILILKVCENMPEPEICENGVKKYWKYIAWALFQEEAARGVCEVITDEWKPPKYTEFSFYAFV